MRLSKPDDTDPDKRRHFEISIDSPFNIMSCRATQANISLPAYSSGNPAATPANEFECGCPGAVMKRRGTPPSIQPPGQTSVANDSPTGPQRSWSSDTGGLTVPTQAHVHNAEADASSSRPMHLLRAPSFNPPAFDADDPPPPLVTPPPLYENAVNGDTRNALADYFARLAEEMPDDDDDHDRSRVDIPLTPGGRVNRSMDLQRSWVPLGGMNLTLPSGQRTPTAV